MFGGGSGCVHGFGGASFTIRKHVLLGAAMHHRNSFSTPLPDNDPPVPHQRSARRSEKHPLVHTVTLPPDETRSHLWVHGACQQVMADAARRRWTRGVRQGHEQRGVWMMCAACLMARLAPGTVALSPGPLSSPLRPLVSAWVNNSRSVGR
ncbi:hypothetical protein E2C01_015830 [Portunus trituberculatus]|uniref:Uncharacterized protein n=1 Tax=Portunus trituberculatus TaxID=210409 RepID=A0A5B7DP93_PORTR|nr:hypothetical protein [Portunus trituberculatus]